MASRVGFQGRRAVSGPTFLIEYCSSIQVALHTADRVGFDGESLNQRGDGGVWHGQLAANMQHGTGARDQKNVVVVLAWTGDGYTTLLCAG